MSLVFSSFLFVVLIIRIAFLEARLDKLESEVLGARAEVVRLKE